MPSAGQGPRIPRRYNVAWNDHLVAVIHAAAHRDRRMRPKTGAKLPTGPPGRSQSPNQAAVTRQAFLGRPKHMSNGKPEATSTLLACMLCREKGGGRFIGRLDRLLCLAFFNLAKLLTRNFIPVGSLQGTAANTRGTRQRTKQSSSSRIRRPTPPEIL